MASSISRPHRRQSRRVTPLWPDGELPAPIALSQFMATEFRVSRWAINLLGAMLPAASARGGERTTAGRC